MRVIDVINEHKSNVIRTRCQFCGEITERHKRYGRTLRTTQCRCDKWLEWIRFVFLAVILVILICIAGGWQPLGAAQYKLLEKQVIENINKEAAERQMEAMKNWQTE